MNESTFTHSIENIPSQDDLLIYVIGTTPGKYNRVYIFHTYENNSPSNVLLHDI